MVQVGYYYPIVQVSRYPVCGPKSTPVFGHSCEQPRDGGKTKGSGAKLEGLAFPSETQILPRHLVNQDVKERIRKVYGRQIIVLLYQQGDFSEGLHFEMWGIPSVDLTF
jgi:hypothetical protein